MNNILSSTVSDVQDILQLNGEELEITWKEA